MVAGAERTLGRRKAEALGLDEKKALQARQGLLGLESEGTTRSV
jgi:hypothetical protein